MDKLLYEISGNDAQLKLFETKLVIKRSGLQGLFKPKKEISLESIGRVELSAASFGAKGFIAFHPTGSLPKSTAPKDMTVNFHKGVEPVFRRMKQLVEQQIQARKGGQRIGTDTGKPQAAKGVYQIESFPHKGWGG